MTLLASATGTGGEDLAIKNGPRRRNVSWARALPLIHQHDDENHQQHGEGVSQPAQEKLAAYSKPRSATSSSSQPR